MDAHAPDHYVIGIDIGGTQTRCALARADRPDHIIQYRVLPTPRGSVTEFLNAIGDSINACMAAEGIRVGLLQAIGCCACGITDSERGIVVDAHNIEGWTDIPIAQLLTDRFGAHTEVENDVNAAALAESLLGAGRACHSMVFFTVSTGVAAGIVIGGELLRGAHQAAGELGFFLPDPRLIDQDWMPSGCLETTSAGVGLAQAWAALCGGSSQADRAIEVFAAARDGHKDAQRLVSRAADYLAQAAVAVGNLIDPDRIVLGGSIARHQPVIIDRMREVTARTLPFPPDIVHGTLGDKAPLVGVLIMAAKRARELW